MSIGIFKLFKLSNVMDFLQIRFGHLKLTSSTPGLSNPCKLRFNSNISAIFATDICRFVGDIKLFQGSLNVQISIDLIKKSPKTAVLAEARLIRLCKPVSIVYGSDLVLQSLLSGRIVEIAEVFCFTEFDSIEV